MLKVTHTIYFETNKVISLKLDASFKMYTYNND